MSDHERPATLAVEQAGALLGISRRSAHRAVANGDIPTIHLDRRILVLTAILRRMLGIHDSNLPSVPNESGHDEAEE